jgi:hypothetical protein
MKRSPFHRGDTSVVNLTSFNAGVEASIIVIAAVGTRLAHNPTPNPFRRAQIVELLFALADDLEGAKIVPDDQQGTAPAGGDNPLRPIDPATADAATYEAVE